MSESSNLIRRIWWTIFDEYKSAFFWPVLAGLSLVGGFSVVAGGDPSGWPWMIAGAICLPLAVIKTRSRLRQLKERRPRGAG